MKKQPCPVLSHPFLPIFDEKSEILILGSFPSVKSREQAFYYGHPQNRFWKMLSAVYDAPPLLTVEEKTAFLLEHRIALWDVIASCSVIGSSDAAITAVEPNDLCPLFSKAKIRTVICNGKTAEKLYNRFLFPKTGVPCIGLPSTSPANAAFSLEKLAIIWREILLS